MSYSYDPDDPIGGSRTDDDDEMFSRRERQEARRARLVSDFVRKAIENTVGQARNTGTMSREALQFILQQGDRGKREVVRIVAKEVGDFFRQLDVSSEVIKVLTSVQVDFNASVRFKRTDDGKVRPDISPESSLSVTDITTPPPAPSGDLVPETDESADKI